jgi:hypothetical protein
MTKYVLIGLEIIKMLKHEKFIGKCKFDPYREQHKAHSRNNGDKAIYLSRRMWMEPTTNVQTGK